MRFRWHGEDQHKMNVLFFISNDGFPAEQEGGVVSPVPVVGGLILTDTERHRAVSDAVGASYEVRDITEIERLTDEQE
jgi:hypothetical protein